MRKGASFRCALLGLVLIAATVAAQARSSWKIDPSQTHVRFWIDAIGWPRTAGEFKSFDGRIDIDFDRPSRSRVDFKVAAKSVDVNSESLDDYLRSAVFLNVANFPDMRSTSTSVEKRNEHLARVTGDLTMLGVTRPISLDVEVARKLAGTNQRVGFKATGVINRLDFGMNSGYPLISDAIHLTVTTEASAEP
ncbi:MAG TPA: YceI family protein [Methylocella sp.]|nr:YceI family protein [Methylocella sp.]